MDPKRIGIIGDGNVGGALARGLKQAGHEVRAVGNKPAEVAETAAWAQVVILAVPFKAIDAALAEAGAGLDGKTLIDATNALGPDMQLAVGFSTSGAEELQKKAPRARVVKAFNTVFAQYMDSGVLDGEALSTFVAGDDGPAKAEVLGLAGDIGFDAIDAGPLRNARLIEPLAVLNIQLGFAQKMGKGIGFKLLHPGLPAGAARGQQPGAEPAARH